MADEKCYELVITTLPSDADLTATYPPQSLPGAPRYNSHAKAAGNPVSCLYWGQLVLITPAEETCTATRSGLLQLGECLSVPASPLALPLLFVPCCTSSGLRGGLLSLDGGCSGKFLSAMAVVH